METKQQFRRMGKPQPQRKSVNSPPAPSAGLLSSVLQLMAHGSRNLSWRPYLLSSERPQVLILENRNQQQRDL